MSRQWEEPDLHLYPGKGDIPVSREISFWLHVVISLSTSLRPANLRNFSSSRIHWWASSKYLIPSLVIDS